MKLIDEKGRLFGKINVIDLCVVLVLVLAVAGFFVKNASFDKAEKTTAPITYTLKVKAVRMQTVNELIATKGKEIRTPKLNELLGTIEEVTYTDAHDFVVDKNGSYVTSIQPDKYDVTVIVTTNGSETPKGIYTEGGKQLFIGEGVGIDTGNAETSGEIMNIKVGK